MGKVRATVVSRQCAPESVGIIGELPDPALGLGVVCGDFCARLDREFYTAVCKIRVARKWHLVGMMVVARRPSFRWARPPSWLLVKSLCD